MKKGLRLVLVILLTYTGKAQQSFNIGFAHDGKNVYGTFTKPNGSGPFPVIIINPGSGANDRHGTIPMVGGNISCLYPNLENDTLRPYKELAEALVDSSYAVLRYDKLEYTYPGNLGTITFHKLWLPVESAIKYVKTRNDVDSNRIILLGHSEGSTLIPFIAKGRTDVKALISVAGARTPFDTVLARQLVYIAQTCGGNVSQAQAQAQQILDYFNVIRTNTWNSGTPALFGVPASAWYDYVQATDPVSSNYNQNLKPSLFIGLGKDINVPLSELNRFKNEIFVSSDFWSLPELVHYMTPDNDPHVSEQLTDTIIYWLRKHKFHTGISNTATVSMQLKAYPNPFGSFLTISSEKSPISSLKISNVYGQVVHVQELITEMNEISIKLPALPQGVYFIECEMAGLKIIRKVIRE